MPPGGTEAVGGDWTSPSYRELKCEPGELGSVVAGGIPHHGQGVHGRAEACWLPQTIPCAVLGLPWDQVNARSEQPFPVFILHLRYSG